MTSRRNLSKEEYRREEMRKKYFPDSAEEDDPIEIEKNQIADGLGGDKNDDCDKDPDFVPVVKSPDFFSDSEEESVQAISNRKRKKFRKSLNRSKIRRTNLNQSPFGRPSTSTAEVCSNDDDDQDLDFDLSDPIENQEPKKTKSPQGPQTPQTPQTPQVQQGPQTTPNLFQTPKRPQLPKTKKTPKTPKNNKTPNQ